MAALLVGLSIMAVMMTVAMPVWRQTVQREKETELVFRGEQYARAIGLFQRKAGPGTLPPSIDVLVQQRYLRKKYKDPITNDDFAPLLLSAANQPGAGQLPGAPPAPRGGFPPGAFAGAQPGGRGVTGGASGGIIGVASKSKEQSIRLYKGRNHYNEWQFVFTPSAQAPGVGGAPGSGPVGPGGQRGRGQGPGNPRGGPFPPVVPPSGQGGRPGGVGPPGGPVNPNNPTPGPIFPPGQPPPRPR